MKKEMTVDEVLNLHRVLCEAKYEKMDGKGVVALVKTIRALRPVAEEYESYRKDVIGKLSEGKSEDNKTWQPAATKALVERLKETVELELPALTIEQCGDLCASNSWEAMTAAEIMAAVCEEG